MEKDAVQPKRNDIYEQINSIMNGTKSKYTSVSEAVEEMKQRSGLNDYLKISEQEEVLPVKTADQNLENKNTSSIDNVHNKIPINHLTDKSFNQHNDIKNNHSATPSVIVQKPNIVQTLQNIINDSRGHLSIPAIVNKLHSLHQKDIPEAADWDDEKLLRLISKMNLEAKKHNSHFDESQYAHLGTRDHSTSSTVDPSNSDAFHSLMPTKINT